MIITAKINFTRILKEKLFAGRNGEYLDLVLFENKKGLDQYGNHGFVVQDVGKEARERGEKGPILGNFKIMQQGGAKPAAQSGQRERPDPGAYVPPAKDDRPDPSDDDVPF
ncbi:MAG: hypothetical protein ACOYD4_04045 [Solirubrobacterales bacterium]